MTAPECLQCLYYKDYAKQRRTNGTFSKDLKVTSDQHYKAAQYAGKYLATSPPLM